MDIMSSITNAVSKAVETTNSAVAAATQGVAESAKAKGPAGLSEIGDLFAFPSVETPPSSEETEALISPEGGFMDPATFIQNLAEAFAKFESTVTSGMKELMGALNQASSALEDELDAMPGILEGILGDMSAQGQEMEIPEQMDDLSALREMQAGVENLVSLNNQANYSFVFNIKL